MSLVRSGVMADIVSGSISGQEHNTAVLLLNDDISKCFVSCSAWFVNAYNYVDFPFICSDQQKEQHGVPYEQFGRVLVLRDRGELQSWLHEVQTRFAQKEVSNE